MTIDEKYIFALPLDKNEFKFVVALDESGILFSSEPARGLEFKHTDLAMKYLKKFQKINPEIRMFTRKITLDKI